MTIQEIQSHFTELTQLKSCFFIILVSILYLITFSAQNVNGYEIKLIEAEELYKNFEKYPVILDGRPLSEWKKESIAKSVNFSWENYTKTDGRGVKYRIFPPEELAKALGNFGIDEHTPVVVYGDADKSWGGEAWVCWMFAWLGHKASIYFLNGGVQSWKKMGYPLSTNDENKRYQAKKYNYELNNSINITADEIKNRKDIALVDVRSTLEWLKGHIPNSFKYDWENFYRGSERKLISPDEVKKILSDEKIVTVLKNNGITTDKKIVYYCTGGIRSAFAWLAHELSGLPKAVNFEGGIEEWDGENKK